MNIILSTRVYYGEFGLGNRQIMKILGSTDINEQDSSIITLCLIPQFKNNNAGL